MLYGEHLILKKKKKKTETFLLKMDIYKQTKNVTVIKTML